MLGQRSAALAALDAVTLIVCERGVARRAPHRAQVFFVFRPHWSSRVSTVDMFLV
jgi:hypothetical protein